MLPEIVINVMKYIADQFVGFIIGVVSGFVVEFVLIASAKGTQLVKLQRRISLAILNASIKYKYDINDPHSIIRDEWSNNLRDIGSNKRKEVLLALESLRQMADVLHDDERKVAFEALRHRLGTNDNREDDKKFLEVMKILV